MNQRRFSHIGAVLEAFGVSTEIPNFIRGLGLELVGNSKNLSKYQRFHKITLAVLRRSLGDIAEHFGDDLPFILLKGEPLERRLFGGRRARTTGDIDLLILPGDLEAARWRLIELGYRRKRGEMPRMWAHNQESWVHRIHGVEVELHWSPAEPRVPTVPLWRCFDGRISFGFDNGLEVDVLPDDLLLLHLALHFHHHMGFAKGLLDIAGWCDHLADRVDSAGLLDDARRWGLSGIVQWPLHTMARLTGRSPPLFDGSADATVQALAAASARAMRGCLAELPSSDLEASLVAMTPQVGPWRAVPLQAATMLVLDGAPTKLSGVARHFLYGPHRIGRMMHRFYAGRGVVS